MAKSDKPNTGKTEDTTEDQVQPEAADTEDAASQARQDDEQETAKTDEDSAPPAEDEKLAEPEAAELSEAEAVDAAGDSHDDAVGAADAEQQSSEAPEAAPAPPPPLQEAPAQRRGGFVALVLGGVVAAAIGFGAAQIVGPLDPSGEETLAALEARLAEQDDRIAALQAEQSDTSRTVDEVAATSAGIDELQELPARMDDLTSRVEELSATVGGFDDRIAALEKRPMTEGLSEEAIAAYQREVEELRAAVADQNAEAEEMRENARTSAQQALARAALTRVISALDSGGPYEAAVTDLRSSTGQDTPDALSAHADTGVATLASLQDTFPDLARRALAQARQAGDGEDANPLASFLRDQLGARSVTPREGSDPDAVLSRAESALRDGRLEQALEEIATLPEPARAVMADWIERAETRLAATQAAETLLQRLNGN
ncbi:COG4223 family protein [Salinihabitans flavidus]|uniref:COG4223 family protein n=1 Tax=Salinihabitans flavidus TaxID=569882 RepID=UPI000B81C24E|nr:mitofilin family membrane protein [Salinihabitans flavidus]